MRVRERHGHGGSGNFRRAGKRFAQRLQKQQVVGGIVWGDHVPVIPSLPGILPVDIDTVETVVLDKLEGTVDEGCPLASIGDKVEVTSLGVCPTTNGEGDLEVTVLEFEEVQLLQATIEVVPCVIP